MAPLAQAAAFDSPVGPWDFTLSGKAAGIAQMTFNADGTIDGNVQIYTKVKLPDPEDNPRGPADTTGSRNGTANTNTTYVTNYAGEAVIDGRWSFDAKGKLVGYLNEGGYTYTTTSTNATTNGISFRGTVSLGAKPRMTLQGSGNVSRTYSGIPETALVDISGTYTATGKRLGYASTEFFTLTSMGGNNNVYNVTQGSRPGFGFDGRALLSGRKQVSMVTVSTPPSLYILTVLVGSINTNKATASLTGRESVNGSVSLKMFPASP
jgi:hypothetical protein